MYVESEITKNSKISVNIFAVFGLVAVLILTRVELTIDAYFADYRTVFNYVYFWIPLEIRLSKLIKLPSTSAENIIEFKVLI